MPKKSLGQHWLKNREILEQIADSAIIDIDSITPQAQVCVEVGPGLGFLTSSLLRRFPRVIAVEFDEDLARKLPGSFPGKDLQVINQDILQYDFGQLKEPFVVVGNIPYYITSPLIRQVLTAKNTPERIVFLMQKEVAERAAGNDKRSFLSVFVENYADAKLGPIVKRDEFTPPPKVDSQVLILQPHQPTVGPEVLKFIKLGFASPRKKLVANLASGLHIPKEQAKTILSRNNFDPDARPADCTLDDWRQIFGLFEFSRKKS